jgi:Cytochrome c554 and c-prime
MLGAIARKVISGLAGPAAVALAVVASAAFAGPAQADDHSIHLGVASCAGSNCHGSPVPLSATAVAQNEYTIWSTRDKHRHAYTVLLDERAIRMAHALGLPDAKSAPICLDCHADNVPPNRRGREFHLSDGVGCEACHGGSSNWLGVHISGAGHEQNLAAGLYPTERPVARAEKCLNCHFGDGKRFVNHRLYGAGHPRLSFELDTFTAAEPAHFIVDKDYVQRKGLITDMQVWSAGQAVALTRRMEALLDPVRSHQGIFPEPALFDCASCHHAYDSLHAPRPTMTGLGPGTVKLDDANGVMLSIAAARLAPDAGAAVEAKMLALHRATMAAWPEVRHDAHSLAKLAIELAPALSRHDFTPGDMRAAAGALIALGLRGGDLTYSHAEQTTMALETLVSAMQSAGVIGGEHVRAIKGAMGGLYEALAQPPGYRPGLFVKALRDVRLAIGGCCR